MAKNDNFFDDSTVALGIIYLVICLSIITTILIWGWRSDILCFL